MMWTMSRISGYVVIISILVHCQGRNDVLFSLHVHAQCLRGLTETFIPDCTGFLFVFKAWSPRIASYVKGFHNAEEGQKDPQGGMRLFGYRLMPQAIKQNARMISDSINQSDKKMVQWAHAL